MDGVELEIEEDAIARVAEKPSKGKTGPEGLRSIMEHVMTDIMYEIPSREDVRKCIITKNAVDLKSEPILIKRDTSKWVEKKEENVS